MAGIRFERLVTRGVGRWLSQELDLAGMKISVENLIRLLILGSFAIFIGMSLVITALGIAPLLAGVVGLAGAGVYIFLIYVVMEFRIDARKTKLEEILPDYLQIASANLRSGIALDRSMLLAARPEFSFLSDDIKEMSRRIFGGENFENALKAFASKYRSYQLNHAVRMMVEALRYGGAMADLLEQISKDMRDQQLMQKEVAGQLFMYSIFIAFAGLVAAPVLYGLTAQMITVTDLVWKGILASNPGGLPTTGISFLKPSPPKISAETYHNFSLAAIIIITGFSALIMSAISSGSPVKGFKYLPLFIVIGISIFFVMEAVIAGVFSSIGGA